MCLKAGLVVIILSTPPFSDIDMINIPAEPIRFNLFYGGNSPIPDDDQKSADKELSTVKIPPVTEEAPQFKDIYIKNIVCKGAGQAIYMQGLSEMKLQNINFENVLIEADKGIQCIDANQICFKNVQIKTDRDPVMHIFNGANIHIEDFGFNEKADVALKVEGEQSENITVNKTKFSNPDKQVVITRNLNKSVLQVK